MAKHSKHYLIHQEVADLLIELYNRKILNDFILEKDDNGNPAYRAAGIVNHLAWRYYVNKHGTVLSSSYATTQIARRKLYWYLKEKLNA